MNKEAFVNDLIGLCEKYGLCVAPVDNDKYELPLEVVPYTGDAKNGIKALLENY